MKYKDIVNEEDASAFFNNDDYKTPISVRLFVWTGVGQNFPGFMCFGFFSV